MDFESHELIGTQNMGYVVMAVKPVSETECVVVGGNPDVGKAVTWRAFNNRNATDDGWLFDAGHYFDRPNDYEGNFRRALSDAQSR